MNRNERALKIAEYVYTKIIRNGVTTFESITSAKRTNHGVCIDTQEYTEERVINAFTKKSVLIDLIIFLERTKGTNILAIIKTYNNNVDALQQAIIFYYENR